MNVRQMHGCTAADKTDRLSTAAPELPMIPDDHLSDGGFNGQAGVVTVDAPAGQPFHQPLAEFVAAARQVLEGATA